MRARRLLLGILVANVVGVLLCLLGFGLVRRFPDYMMVASVPSLFLVPFCMGITAAWIWNPLELGLGQVLLHSLSGSMLGVVVAAIVFREGRICLIIISPGIYGGFVTGALLGRLWFRRNHDRLNLCLAPLLAAVVVAEPALRSPRTSVVTDEIRIAAPPARVWPHVLAFGPITEPPGYWLFRLGLPYPTETTNGGDFVGADRACRFSGGAMFKEKVAGFEPNRRLIFDIVEMPTDPELMGHLDAHRGEFELRDNGDGTTTLIGRTWYSLHVRPAWYFDWWTHDIFRAVHLRVMRNVKRLAEAQP